MKKILMIVGIAVGVALISAGATYFILSPKLGKTVTKVVMVTPVTHYQIGSTYSMATRVVNLSDTSVLHYLKITVVIAFSDKQSDVTSKVTPREVALQDILTNVLGNETSDMLSSAQGKDDLKQLLMKQFKSILSDLSMTDILFPDFVMQ